MHQTSFSHFAGVILILGAASGCGRQSEIAETGAKEQGNSVAKAIGGLVSRPAPLEIAAGSQIRVRTTRALSTKTDQSGASFAATLVEPIVVDGRVAVPAGAAVTGVIADSDSGGRVKGRARLSLRLTSVRLQDGRSVDLRTNTTTRVAPGTKKTDAVKIGVGSGIGAAIGAIAGGGKGAAIGAGAGAGAGTATVLATRGAPAVVPAETLLSFRLKDTVSIRQ